MNIAMPPRKRPPPPVVFTTSTCATARVVLGSSSVYSALDPSPEPTVDSPVDTPLDSPVDSPLDPSLNPPLEPNTTVVASTQPEREKKASLIWTDIMEETMFDALLEQDRRGKRADAGFKLEAWTLVREAVQQVYIGCLSIEVS